MARMKTYALFDDYLADQPPPNRAIISAVRDFVRRVAPRLTEAVKWGNGCWLGRNGPVAYVYSATGYVQFGFFRGSTLEDPRGLLEGDGKVVRHIKLRNPQGIDERAFGVLLRQAIRLNQELVATSSADRGGRAGMAGIVKLSVAARIVVVAPPPGVVFALQRGRRELGEPLNCSGQDLRFEFTVLAQRAPDGSARFSGEFVQGPAGGKFVYVNSGTLAGQAGSKWTRRAKVGLQTLSWTTVERAAATGAALQARIAGVGRDGGPACASVPLLDQGWIIEAGQSRGGRTRG